MGKIIGIDLGTTNSLVATVDSGIPYVIADADGQRLTPSVVHFPAAGAAPLVGHAANRVRVLRPLLPAREPTRADAAWSRRSGHARARRKSRRCLDWLSLAVGRCGCVPSQTALAYTRRHIEPF